MPDSIKQLRLLALRPMIGIFGVLAWFSLDRLITSNIANGFAREAVATYVTLTMVTVIVWGFSSATKQYRMLSFDPNTDEGRYHQSSKTFAFVMNIIALSFIFLGGFGVFSASIFGFTGDAPFVERLVLTYLPIIIDAGIVAYGVYFGLVANRGGNEND